MKKFKIKEEMAVNAGGAGEYSTPKAFKKYRIKEIKVNKPDLANTILDLLIELGDKIDLGWYFSKFNISEDGNGPLDNIRNSPRENQLALYNYLKNKYINENHLPEPKDFPIKISSYEQAQLVGQWLQKYGYNLNIDQPPFNTKPLLNPFYIKADGKDIHWNVITEIKLSESKYSQFKQSTSKPNPKQVLHKAIKEIQLKLDEVNKLIDFTSRIKGELTEGDQEIEYLKRTKDNINKIQNRLKEVFNKLCELDEIKINKPKRVWDFTKYIPDLNMKDIKIGDIIKNKTYSLEIDDIKDEGNNLLFYSPNGMDDEETLNQINDRNKKGVIINK